MPLEAQQSPSDATNTIDPTGAWEVTNDSAEKDALAAMRAHGDQLEAAAIDSAVAQARVVAAYDRGLRIAGVRDDLADEIVFGFAEGLRDSAGVLAE